ncbi:MAG: SDR family NAD(P)-dependent oxidoreductase, partial [Pseudomonadales bacterium]
MTRFGLPTQVGVVTFSVDRWQIKARWDKRRITMSGLLEGKVAVVTGASRGIGEALAIRYAMEGAKVVVSARTQNEGDHQFAGSIQS